MSLAPRNIGAQHVRRRVGRESVTYPTSVASLARSPVQVLQQQQLHCTQRAQRPVADRVVFLFLARAVLQQGLERGAAVDTVRGVTCEWLRRQMRGLSCGCGREETS